MGIKFNMNFRAYAEQKGIKLLKDDLSWLRMQFSMLQNEQRGVAMKRYIDEWCVGSQVEKERVKSQNSGRKRANEWLLNFVCERR